MVLLCPGGPRLVASTAVHSRILIWLCMITVNSSGCHLPTRLFLLQNWSPPSHRFFDPMANRQPSRITTQQGFSEPAELGMSHIKLLRFKFDAASVFLPSTLSPLPCLLETTTRVTRCLVAPISRQKKPSRRRTMPPLTILSTVS